MILYFLRHADAGPMRSRDDDARELTAAGESELRSAAPFWRNLGVRPDIVISSPLPRARRTAELLVEGLGTDRPIAVDERLRPGATWSEVSAALLDHPETERVVFVGHQPDLSTVIELLSGASRVAMHLGGMARLEFDAQPGPGTGRIAWLLDPDLWAPHGDADP